MTGLVGVDGKPLDHAPRPVDLVQVPVALFEAMHQKMAEMAELEEILDEAFDSGKSGWDKLEQVVTNRGTARNA